MPKIYRTIQLKVVEYRTVGEFEPRPIDELIREIRQRGRNVEDRHIPAIEDVEEGERCGFIDRIANTPGRAPGVVFRFCSYVKGELPTGFEPEFGKPSANLTACRLADAETGEAREPVGSFYVLAWGQIVVVEVVRGAGGIRSLEKCLTELIRRFVDEDHPRVNLIDAGATELIAAIDRAGGVKEVILDAAVPHQNPHHRFGQTLSEARRKIGGANLVRLHYKAAADGELQRDDVLRAYEDLEAEEIDRLVLVLRDGNQLVGEDKFKIRTHVSFNVEPNGHLTEISIVRALAQYVVDLRQEHDGTAVLTDDGQIARRED